MRDYDRLHEAGIRIPRMPAVDRDAERIVKDYIEGPTVMELVRSGVSVEPYLPQVRDMAAKAMAAGLNIDYYPTNFVVHNGLLWYVDYVEPVCTIPDYRGKGIAAALLSEAFSRAKALGAKKAYVISDLPLYEKLGFQKAQHYSFYRKEK